MPDVRLFVRVDAGVLDDSLFTTLQSCGGRGDEPLDERAGVEVKVEVRPDRFGAGDTGRQLEPLQQTFRYRHRILPQLLGEPERHRTSVVARFALRHGLHRHLRFGSKPPHRLF